MPEKNPPAGVFKTISELVKFLAKAPSQDKIGFAFGIILLLGVVLINTWQFYTVFAISVIAVIFLMGKKEERQNRHEIDLKVLELSEQDDSRRAALWAAAKRIAEEKAMRIEHEGALVENVERHHLPASMQPDTTGDACAGSPAASGKKREE